MPKGKRSQESTDLEDQLRTMILSNVRMTSEHASQDRPGRGRGGNSSAYPSSRHHNDDYSAGTSLVASSSMPSPEYARNDHVSNIPASQHVQHRNTGHQHRGSGSFRGFRRRGQHAFETGHRERASTTGTFTQSPYEVSEASHSQPASVSSFKQTASSPSSAFGGTRNALPAKVPPMAAFIAQCELLDRIATDEIPRIEMTPAEYLDKEAFRARLEILCRDEVARAFPELTALLNLRAYGSIASGFATQGSDVDLTIVWSHSTRDDIEFNAKLPRVVERAILRAQHGARLLSRTRVPIVKVCQMPTEDLYAALLEERQKWEELPEDEKFPELASQPALPLDEDRAAESEQEKANVTETEQPNELDPDLSRNGKKMDVLKRVTMNDDPLGFLVQLKSKQRTEEDDLTRYCTQFINARRFSLQSSDTDDHTYAEWFLEGMPTTVVQMIIDERAINLQSNAAFPNRTLFDQYYEVAQPIISRLNAVHGKKEKPWLREKALGKLDFPKTGVGIQCDINFSNPLGMHNTELLRLYSLCDSRVRPMVLFIKAWAKRRKINSAYNGTLSSYGYVLMVLHFLINVAQPPVLPNLQLVFGAGERKVLTDGGYNISFYRDEAAIRQMAATRQWTQNTEPLGVLLRNFYHYYAAQGTHVISTGFNWMRDVISIRTPKGIMSKEWKGWTGAKTVQMGAREIRQRYLLAIEDPFELDHNVGRPVTHNGIVTIRDEFRRAWRILMAVGRGTQPEGHLFDSVIEDVATDAVTTENNTDGGPENAVKSDAGHV